MLQSHDSKPRRRAAPRKLGAQPPKPAAPVRLIPLSEITSFIPLDEIGRDPDDPFAVLNMTGEEP